MHKASCSEKTLGNASIRKMRSVKTALPYDVWGIGAYLHIALIAL